MIADVLDIFNDILDAGWERAKRFVGTPDELYALQVANVLLCMKFLERCERTDKPCGAPVFRGSYGLKHVVEHHFNTYVHELELVIAAKQLGIVLKPPYDATYKGSYDVGVTQKSVWEIMREKR